jgi:hypothetical protein
MFTIAILADMMAVNRQLLEKIELHLKSTDEVLGDRKSKT